MKFSLKKNDSITLCGAACIHGISFCRVGKSERTCKYKQYNISRRVIQKTGKNL